MFYFIMYSLFSSEKLRTSGDRAWPALDGENSSMSIMLQRQLPVQCMARKSTAAHHLFDTGCLISESGKSMGSASSGGDGASCTACIKVASDRTCPT